MQLLFIKSLQFFISLINYGNSFHINFKYLKYLSNLSFQSRFSIQGVVKMAAILDFAIFLKKPSMKDFHFCWKMICEIPSTSWWKNLRWPFFFHLKNFRHGVFIYFILPIITLSPSFENVSCPMLNKKDVTLCLKFFKWKKMAIWDFFTNW